MKPHNTIAAAAALTLLAIGGSFPAMAQSNPRLIAPLLDAPSAEVPIHLRSLTSFHNPNSRQMEGELQFSLQPGQQVSGFALGIDGHMRPAVPLGKARPDSRAVDVGGGASALVDNLIENGVQNITVLDMSAEALDIHGNA